MNLFSIQNNLNEENHISSNHSEFSCNNTFKQIQYVCKMIFSYVPSYFTSDKKLDLERCIEELKTIPTLSQQERMNWNSWFRLHSAALQAFSFRLPGLSIDFKIPFPWHVWQIRLEQFITHSGLRTACGITQQIALTKLLGAASAAWLAVVGKPNQLEDLNLLLKSDNPLLLAFQIPSGQLKVERGSPLEYEGHVWTIFRANSDRYLMVTSYLHQQNASVMELNSQEMQTHIKDMHVISKAKIWTEKIDEIYKKWFGASCSELIGYATQKTLPIWIKQQLFLIFF